MNINKLIKECHENAVEKGFYNCGGCDGSGLYYQKNPDCKNCEAYKDCGNTEKEYCCISSVCDSCKGKRIDQNKNIPELLMLVITEVSEAVEALRCGNYCEKINYYIENYDEMVKEDCQNAFFSRYIHSTFEDEIADVFIRLFDLCGYLEIEIDENEWQQWPIKIDLIHNKSEALFEIIQKIISLKKYIKFYKDGKEKYIELINMNFIDIFKHLEFFCNHNNIPIERHIKAKMEYNKTRPKKHGKEF